MKTNTYASQKKGWRIIFILTILLSSNIFFIGKLAAAGLTVTPSVTNVACFNGLTGAISISVTGGDGNYTYIWSNFATTQNIQHLFAGTYTVTVSDIGSADVVASATITQPPSLPQFQATITNIACFGQCTGAITVTPNGGTPDYTYSWSNGSTLKDLSGLCPGFYGLTVTDFNGCKAPGGHLLQQLPSSPLTVTPTVVNVTCSNPSAGSITLSVTGGIGTYHFLWSNGSIVQNLLNAVAGTYTVTVTDGGPCNVISGGTITQPPAVNAVATGSLIGCSGGSTGTASVTASGGTPGYSYLWNTSPGQTTQTAGNLAAGTYTVTVTDVNSCTATASATVILGGGSGIVTSTINSNFNGTPIAGGHYIWFTSVMKVSGVSSFPVTINLTNQSITSSFFSLSPPDAMVTINASGTASTNFSGGQLITVAPTGLPGNYFLSAMIYQVPGGGLPGGINPVSWKGDFSSNEAGVTIKWQWAAAVYTSFNNDYNALGIKPCDANNASIYLNSDHAGTPENYKSFVTGGARGGGGSNYTGSYSGTATVVTIQCKSGMVINDQEIEPPAMDPANASGLSLTVVPNPFVTSTDIRFSSPADTRVTIDLYNSFGTKVTGIFDSTVKANELNTVHFTGNGLHNGLYMVIMHTGMGEKVTKLIVNH